jgi:hypothetical protein
MVSDVVTFALALSIHLGMSDGLNAVHPAVYWQQDGWFAGAFLNSRESLAFAAGRRFGDRAWLDAGVVSGYKYPVAVRGGVNLNDHISLWAAPGVEKTGERGVVLGIEFRLH